MNSLKNLLQASYGDRKASSSLEKQGYTKDPSLSGKRVQVYTDPQGKATVVHRGTKGLKDIGTDLYVSLGGDIKKTDRYKFSKQQADKAREKYGDVTNVGHSLGGKLAETTAQKHEGIVTFNKAATLQDIGKQRNPNQLDIRHKNDLVSAITKTQRGGKTQTLKNKTKNALTAHDTKNLNFL